MRCGIDLICVHEAHGIVIIIERLCRSRRLIILFLQPIVEVKPVSCRLPRRNLRQRIRTENWIAAHIPQTEIIPALVCQRLRSVCRNGAVGIYVSIAPPRHRAIAAYPCVGVVICIPVDLAVIPRKHTRHGLCRSMQQQHYSLL